MNGMGRTRCRACLRCNKRIHRNNLGLRGENLLGENAVNFLVGVETGIFEYDASVVQVEGAPHRREGDTTRRDSKEDQVFYKLLKSNK